MWIAQQCTRRQGPPEMSWTLLSDARPPTFHKSASCQLPEGFPTDMMVPIYIDWMVKPSEHCHSG